jgi:putative RNA 2'-phosphotransferase
MNDTKVSKFLSLVLRHKPSAANLFLDKHGWADVETLLKQTSFTLFNDSTSFVISDLERIVKEDSKGRYSFSEDKKKIRANQGHSINVDVQLKENSPPEVLYHGTANKFLTSIFTNGIKKMSRQYVHLSDNYETALKVGSRHGTPVVLSIRTKLINRKFLLSENGVWLIDHIYPHEIELNATYNFVVGFSYPEELIEQNFSVESNCLEHAEDHVKELARETIYGQTCERPLKLRLISVK